VLEAEVGQAGDEVREAEVGLPVGDSGQTFFLQTVSLKALPSTEGSSVEPKKPSS